MRASQRRLTTSAPLQRINQQRTGSRRLLSSDSFRRMQTEIRPRDLVHTKPFGWPFLATQVGLLIPTDGSLRFQPT
jgi:hypothetical protein